MHSVPATPRFRRPPDRNALARQADAIKFKFKFEPKVASPN
jgi:hypothetical protein